MSYSRPSDYPDWGTGTPNESDSGLPVSTGYPDDGIPTAKGWNWLMRRIGLWIRWFDQQIQGMVASLIGNDSSVTGTTVKDALNTLWGQVTDGIFNITFQDFGTMGAGKVVEAAWRKVTSATSGMPAMVTLTIKGFVAASEGTSFGAATALGTGILPSFSVSVGCDVVDGSNTYRGIMTIDTSGNITFSKLITAEGYGNRIGYDSVFSDSANKGIANAVTIQYAVWP